MTYSTQIADRDQEILYLLKIDGVDRYFMAGPVVGSTWDDSAYGNTHGSLTILHNVIGMPQVSGGEVDYKKFQVTDTTLSFALANSAYLETLFSRRLTPQQMEKYVGGDMTTSTTDVTVGDTSNMSADDYLYVGRECVKISSVTSGTRLSIARGQLGTRAEPHRAGVLFSTSPRRWLDVRVHLVLGIKERDGSWVFYDPALTCWIDNSPSFQNGLWRIRCSNSIRHFDRQVHTGFRQSSVLEASIGYNAYYDVVYSLYLDSIETFLEPSDYDYQTPGILIEASQQKGCFAIYDIATSGDDEYVQIDQNAPNVLANETEGWPFHKWLEQVGEIVVTMDDERVVAEGLKARVVYPQKNGWGTDTTNPDRCPSSNPALAALRLMLSDEGDGSNHIDYDRIPGQPATETTELIRGGAGLTTDDVDVDAWEEAAEQSFPSHGWIGGEQESLVDILTDDVCPMLCGYLYVTRAGKLSIKLYEQAACGAAVTATLTTSNTDHREVKDNAIDDETLLVATVEISGGYDWGKKKFNTLFPVHYEEAEELYDNRANVLEIRSRFAAAAYEEVVTLADAWHARWGQGAIVHEVSAPWTTHLVMPADNVRYTNPRLPDYEGGEGISGVLCEVVSAAQDLQRRRCKLKIAQRDTAKMIAPSAYLGSYIGSGVWFAYYLYSGVEDISEEWATGWRVQFMDPATGNLRTASYSYATIYALNSTRMQFTNAPTDICVGDIVLLAQWDDVQIITTTNTDKGAAETDFAYISGSGFNPAGAGHKWA